MRSRYRALCAALLLTLFFAPSSFAVEPPLPRVPPNYVVDLAGIIDDGVEQRLNGQLRELEQKTTAQVVVLTIRSLEGESLEDFSLTTAHDTWGIGRKGKDNGVLIVVAAGDRKYRFEIGYGLEGVLPDSRVGSIGRDYLVPSFQKGDYSTGIYAATLAVAREIAASENVTITGLPRLQAPARRVSPRARGGPLNTIFFILFVIGAVILFIRHPRLFMLLLLSSMMGGGRRGGGWGGGGGFGGGGGGFGGGGASGGW